MGVIIIYTPVFIRLSKADEGKICYMIVKLFDSTAYLPDNGLF